MKPRINTRVKDIKTGTALIAKPFWRDGLYHRSVVVITRHDEDGTIGLMLNKQHNMKIQIMLKGMEVSLPVYLGGPFKPDAITCLQNTKSLNGTDASMQIADNVYLRGAYDVIKDITDRNSLDFRKARFFSGYVYWKEGELMQEINDGKWWTTEMTGKELIDADSNTLWSTKLLDDGHPYGVFINEEDPSLN